MKHQVQMRWGIRIPMRDGVRLNATLYLPRDLNEPRPTIFTFTPYVADDYHEEGSDLASHGYPYLAIDVRGRGNSEGEFQPLFQEAADGHDIVEWIARQPYCNGKVATRGHSYVAFDQWATVRAAPEHLATIVPSAPCYVGVDYPIRFNIFSTFVVNWLILCWGNTMQRKMMDDNPRFWAEQHLRFLESGLPFKDILGFFGFESKAFPEWLQHPHQDAHWDQANPTPKQLADLAIPVLSLTGQYDGDQPGTLEFYRLHLQHAKRPPEHYLVIGPWDHDGVRRPKSNVVGIQNGPAAALDAHKLHRDWYAWTMEGGPRPEFLKKKVAHYVTGTDKWRYADTLAAVTARTEALYLDSAENPSDPFHSGTMTAQVPARPQPDHYIYDPRDLSSPRAEAMALGVSVEEPPKEAGKAEEASYLFYHSEPFKEDTEISGIFKLTAWLSLDQPDTDFMLMLFDISDDGSAVYLTQATYRARYREGLRVEKLIDTTEPLRYDFDRFFFVSRRMAKGHRLRLMMGPNHSIYWQKNYNSGKPVAEQTMQDARPVTVKLFHDAAHPSALYVPIGHAED
jgi:hypothetical protein